MNVPDNITSGFGLENVDDNFIDTIAIYMIFTKDAIKIAKVYCEHSGRTELSAYDYILGLKARFKHEAFFQNTANFDEQLSEIKEGIARGDILSTLGLSDNSDADLFWKSECSCETCSKINETDTNWETYIESRRDSMSPLNELVVDAIEDTVKCLP